MSHGLFDYPEKAAFGRILPKSKVFAFGKVRRCTRDRFASDVDQIVWRFKLAPATTNLPAASGVAEIQVFGVELKDGVTDIPSEILKAIDCAIAFPIIFEITARREKGDQLKIAAAYKRPSETDASKWVFGDHFSTGWLATTVKRSPLPVALNLAGLYDQMLRELVPIDGRAGETIEALAARYRLATGKQREIKMLESQLGREKQFNRKVEINARLRAVKSEWDELTGGKNL